jgi:hypothetical protein
MTPNVIALRALDPRLRVRRVPAGSVEFSTTSYEFDHGRSPRGTGHWAFCLRRDYDRDDYLARTLWLSGQFSVVKRQAAKLFAAIGETDIVVCS